MGILNGCWPERSLGKASPRNSFLRQIPMGSLSRLRGSSIPYMSRRCIYVYTESPPPAPRLLPTLAAGAALLGGFFFPPSTSEFLLFKMLSCNKSTFSKLGRNIPHLFSRLVCGRTNRAHFKLLELQDPQRKFPALIQQPVTKPLFLCK